MIKSFKGKSSEKIWIREKVRAFPPDILIRARRKLLMLDVASTLDDLKIPASNRLETLRGNRRGSYSIRINEPVDLMPFRPISSLNKKFYPPVSEARDSEISTICLW